MAPVVPLGFMGDIISARQRCPAKIPAFGKPRHGARPEGLPVRKDLVGRAVPCAPSG